MEIKKRNTRIGIGILVIAVLVFLDQFTKHLAVLHLKDQPNIIWIQNVMELEYLENRGAAFGILQNQQWLFILLFFLFVTAVIVFYCRMPMNQKYLPIQIISLFLIAGGLGNLIDRIRLGYVIDFFYFSLINFPVFTVADIYVTVSMAILFVLLIFYYKEEDLDLLFSLGRKKEKS